jgi:CRISPR type III-B/RAMP module-associated protein Cmr5
MAGVRTLDQERAKYAWGYPYEKDYVNLVKGAPILIMGNGLMQAMAYYQNKSKEGQALVRQVSGWLSKMKLIDGNDFTSMMKSLHQADSVRYVQATTETLEIVKWIKQIGAATAKE